MGGGLISLLVLLEDCIAHGASAGLFLKVFKTFNLLIGYQTAILVITFVTL